MKNKNSYSLFVMLIFICILQLILKSLYKIPYFSILSYIKNVFFSFIFIISFVLKKYEWLFMIPIIYGLQYILYPSYIGQDILALPATLGPYCLANLQVLQNDKSHQQFLNDAHISLNDKKINFWYEYYNFIFDNTIYYFWLNRPGKHDDKLNCMFYKIDIQTGERDMMIQTQIPKSAYKAYKKKDIAYSEVNTDIIQYHLRISFIDKKKEVYIQSQGITVNIVGTIESADNYSGMVVFNQFIPITKIPRIVSVSDAHPNELMNDTFAISNALITINNEKKQGICWFDIYSGDGYYYMTNYIWTMNYTKHWNIFILFYSASPYNTFMVYFIFDKTTKQTVNCGNIWINNKTNDMLTGVNGSINLYGTQIQDQDLKYTVTFKSPQVQCTIHGKNIYKALHNFPLYKRLTPGKKYGKGEEIHTVMEQLRYDEFGGKSEVELQYKGKTYRENSYTVIDGVSWQPGKTGPDGYAKRNESFFKQTFYVEHPDRDRLNGKIN